MIIIKYLLAVYVIFLVFGIMAIIYFIKTAPTEEELYGKDKKQSSNNMGL